MNGYFSASLPTLDIFNILSVCQSDVGKAIHLILALMGLNMLPSVLCYQNSELSLP